ELYRDYQQSRRWYLLVGSELSVIQGGGPAGRTGETVVDRPLVSPRLGVESEVISDRLRLRAGSYYETARVAGTHSRVQGTAGFDAKFLRGNVFGLLAPFAHGKLSMGVDAAPLYF